MYCYRCGRPVVPGARFCSHCGASLEVAPSGARRRLWPAAGLVLLIAVVGLSLAAGGAYVLRAKASKPGADLRAAAGEPAPSSLAQTAPPVEGDLRAPSGPGMPAAIRAYLEHVERIERERRRVTQTQLGQATAYLAQMGAKGLGQTMRELLEADPAEPGAFRSEESTRARTRERFAGWREEWERLLGSFASVTPPEQCVPLQRHYDEALRETKAMMSDLIGALEASESDPERALSFLYGMQGQSGSIDQAARRADDEVGSLCERYRTRKWFSIMTDMGSGLLSRFGGLGGGF